MNYFVIAYRNMWRNKKRTLIIILSISFALSSVIYMNGITLGMHQKAIDTAVKAYTGYFQIQSEDYFNEKIIDNAFEDSSIDKSITTDEEIKAFSRRLESFALASNGLQTKGALVVGINQEDENELTGIQNKLTEGYFSDSNGVVLGKGLAEYLEATPGDTIILVGQGYHGFSAAGEYVVTGIINYPSAPNLDKQVIYMPLETSQYLFSADGLITSIAFSVNDINSLDNTMARIQEELTLQSLSVLPWNKIMPELETMLNSDMQSIKIIMVILYIIVGFGIMGTVLMMTIERRREFGIMIAVGMKKIKIKLMLAIEMLCISILGILTFIPVTLPGVYYLYLNPIPYPEAKARQLELFGYEPYMYMAWQSDYIIHQITVIFIIACVASVYPILRSTRIKNLPDALKI